MKTHEEIKLGLEHCLNRKNRCAGCPYWDVPSAKCSGTLLHDATTHIESLKEALNMQVVREITLVAQYGECVDKTVAAKILGVTRATVYAMIADGRIRAAMGGKRVDVRSIARFMDDAGRRDGA